ncbi:hypothetical protein Tco_1135879 [Tanacetum coccineum]
MCHHLSGATWPVHCSGTVTGATARPPVNGGQRRSTTVRPTVNGGGQLREDDKNRRLRYGEYAVVSGRLKERRRSKRTNPSGASKVHDKDDSQKAEVLAGTEAYNKL